jgi:hypothetical protein
MVRCANVDRRDARAPHRRRVRGRLRGALVYAGVKTTEGVLAEALNLLGPLGWGVKAAITGTVTGMVGILFWGLCETPPAWLQPTAA